jgi:signal peptidase I
MGPESATYQDIQPLRLPAEQRSRVRRAGTLLGLISTLTLTCAILLVVVAAVAMVLGLARFTVVDSGSMRPTLNPGDVVMLTSEPAADMAVGQIVAFHPPGEPKLTVIHRVRAIRDTRSGIIFRTKGDANNAADPWRAKIIGNTVWRKELKVPWLGYPVVWSQRPDIRMAVLTLALALAVSLVLAWIWRPTARRDARYSAVSER